MKAIPRLLISLLALCMLAACAAPTPTPDMLQLFLGTFPLVKGATWVYTDTEYDPRHDNPTQIIQAVYEVTEQVTEVKRGADAYLAEVRQTVKKVSADEGWSEASHNPPQAEDFWYIFHENRLYRASALPEHLGAIDYTALTLEFQFPMAQDAQWCPNPSMGQEKMGPDFSGPTPYPCQYAGMRIIRKAGPQQIQMGNFERCYQMGDMINGGGIVQTFCDGTGIVTRKFDHGGTRFGFDWALTEFHK